MPGRGLPILFVFLLTAGALPGGGIAAPKDDAAENKLDPFLRRVAHGVARHAGLIADRLPARSREAIGTLPPFVRVRRDQGLHDDPVLFVKARLLDEPGANALLEDRLRSIGVEVRARAGGIASLAVPSSALEALASIPEVRWLKAARSYRLTNEVSTGDNFTGARTENIVFGDAGEGVIVAVIDTGIDWSDDDFRNTDGSTRILGIWDQTLSDPAHPPPAGFSFGSFYSQADIDLANSSGIPIDTSDGHSHGTHVAGTAAGNGRHTGNGVPVGTFAGMAPKADLLIVRVFDSAGNFCNACDLTAATVFVDQFARTAGKPWVGNMSLGDPVAGAHDGTNPDELAIDALVGPGRPGAQMAIAAGNEGRSTRHSHWEGTLATGQTFSTSFPLGSAAPNSGNDNDFVWLDLWYKGADAATVEILTPFNQTISAARGGTSGLVCTTAGAVLVDATNAPDPENGDNEVFVQIWDSGACSPVASPATGTWTVRIVTTSIGGPTGGTFDLWNASDTPRAVNVEYVQFTSFTAGKMVSIPGTSRNAVTAGAFVGKGSWINAAQVNFAPPTSAGIGSLCAFSSTGPTRDGRTKPDIAAPGEYVGSSRSRFASYNQQFAERDAVHADKAGTSMATPHVAGAIALLFGIDPALDGAQARAALQRAARADFFTGTLPNNRFGAGKLRALDAAYEAASMVTDLQAGAAIGDFSFSGHTQIDSWNVYRGPLPGISATNYGTCFLSGLATPEFSDSLNPPLGTGFLYLVTGVYTSPTTLLSVEGTLG
ncbi:MAG TPA: S8 family serine peptidase, partial [Candidatus Cryosericum sp.]|nr:S8 family serine peptidase [Candidatus Cryosericum sp.]